MAFGVGLSYTVALEQCLSWRVSGEMRRSNGLMGENMGACTIGASGSSDAGVQVCSGIFISPFRWCLPIMNGVEVSAFLDTWTLDDPRAEVTL